MSFSDSPAVVADELARRLESQPSVVGTDRLSADVSPANAPNHLVVIVR